MATLAGKRSDPIALLRDLCELDYDAVEAYEAAIGKLGDPGHRAAMQRFCDDHRRHITELNVLIQDLGGTPVLSGDLKRLLTKGKVLLASLGSDRAILAAMKTNEDDTNVAYERAAGQGGLDRRTAELLRRNLADERQHRAWIEQTLASLGDDRKEGRVSRTSYDRVSAQSIV
jgi:uncharacterized protein (TIGR02284 family)